MRQANILRWGFEHGYARTVLIGSDSPQLPRAVVRDAFATLVEHDVAMGRTHDGGYYLIGMRGCHDVLTGVPMSTATAADALAHALRPSACVSPSYPKRSTSTRSAIWRICGPHWPRMGRPPPPRGLHCTG